jgi:hypothetical protein
MASVLYPLGKKALLDGDIDMLVNNLKVLLIDVSDETYNAADQFHSNITGAGIVATSGNLAGKTTTAGVFDANDITITAVTGDTVEAVILYYDTGVSGTSPLIAWFDVATFTPNGSDALLTWNASGIFAI